MTEFLKPLVENISDELKENELFGLTKLLYQYQYLFKSPDGQVGQTNLVQHRVDIGNVVPIKQHLRCLPVSQQELVDKEPDKMEAQGIIEPSHSPWSSSLVTVTKKTRDTRDCVDYLIVNNVMRKFAIPLPRIQECLDFLSGSKCLCTMDLAQGYCKIAMYRDDKYKLILLLEEALGSSKSYLSALTNEPGTFMHIFLCNVQK